MISPSLLLHPHLPLAGLQSPPPPFPLSARQRRLSRSLPAFPPSHQRPLSRFSSRQTPATSITLPRQPLRLPSPRRRPQTPFPFLLPLLPPSEVPPPMGEFGFRSPLCRSGASRAPHPHRKRRTGASVASSITFSTIRRNVGRRRRRGGILTATRRASVRSTQRSLLMGGLCEVEETVGS
jgi:hypothetical protein